MRILFVSAEHAATLGTGGVGSYVATITKALVERGHDVHILSCLPGTEVADSRVDGVHLHRRPVITIKGLARLLPWTKSRQALLLAISNYWFARRLGRFDVVEAPDWRAEGLLFTLLPGTPAVIHLHTPNHVLQEFNEEVLDRDSRLLSWLERTAARRSARITCPAELLVEHLRGQGWLRRHRVDIIRYPVDLERFATASMERPQPASVLYVGRLERRKAPERILYALRDLERRGISAVAVFVGRGSGVRDGLGYGEWMQREASELGVRCSFVGESQWAEIPQHYRAAHVVCVPSLFESFSMAVVEGMASACPVVMSDRVGASELLAANDNYAQVCRNDGELVESLARFLVEPAAAAKAGAANREIVAAACDPSIVAEARERLFEQIAR